MNLWILFTIAALAEGSSQNRASAISCPDLCSCSFPSSTMVEVMCSQSSLTHFPSNKLSSNTTQLSIQSTSLGSVTAGHLSALPLLINLQLYHTNLTSLPSDLLKYVPDLNLLDLTGNQLVHLPPKVFSHDSLRSLVLKNNLLESADTEWFSDNSTVTWLDLSGNRLKGVPAALLQKLPDLEDLDLSDNNLEDLHPDALRNLQCLESLNLAGNKLTTLSPTMFTHNPKLSHVFFQENQLQEIPGTLVHGLQHLELLMLNENRLQHFPSGLLDERQSFFRVILSENPWVCDRKLEYLWKWLMANPENIHFLEETTCAEPEALKGRQVVSLTGRELGLTPN